MAEGIPVNLVEFSDNRPVLDMLLSRPLGLLALLDEESRFPRATDRSFIRKSLVFLPFPLFQSTQSNDFPFFYFSQKNATTISNPNITFAPNRMQFALQFIILPDVLCTKRKISWKKIAIFYRPK